MTPEELAAEAIMEAWERGGPSLRERIAEAIRQARAEALGKSTIKLVATQFYFWWANQPETNTYQGFDAWWEAEGERFVENLHALKERSDDA